MTDEQIEVALKECGDITRKICNCPYDDDSIEGSCILQLCRDSLDYINRLKAEKEQAYKHGIMAVIGELKGESAIATYTFNSMLASELKTIYLRLEKEYGIED